MKPMNELFEGIHEYALANGEKHAQSELDAIRAENNTINTNCNELVRGIIERYFPCVGILGMEVDLGSFGSVGLYLRSISNYSLIDISLPWANYVLDANNMPVKDPFKLSTEYRIHTRLSNYEIKLPAEEELWSKDRDEMMMLSTLMDSIRGIWVKDVATKMFEELWDALATRSLKLYETAMHSHQVRSHLKALYRIATTSIIALVPGMDLTEILSYINLGEVRIVAVRTKNVELSHGYTKDGEWRHEKTRYMSKDELLDKICEAALKKFVNL